MNDLDKTTLLDLHLATLQGVCIYVSLLPQDGSETFLSKSKLCSCGTKPQHSGNHQYLQLHDDVSMRTPMPS